jgi:hypothetical protein
LRGQMMFKNFHFIITLLFSLLILHNCVRVTDPTTNLSKSEAADLVLTHILKSDTLGKSLHSLPYSLNRNDKVQSSSSEYSVNYNSWFFLIDDDFYKDWRHPCRYVFVSVSDFKYDIYNEDRYPTIMAEMDTIKIWPLE